MTAAGGDGRSDADTRIAAHPLRRAATLRYDKLLAAGSRLIARLRRIP